jgi:hypothetical protein
MVERKFGGRMSISIRRTSHPVSQRASTAAPSLSAIKHAYEKGVEKNGYRLIEDPETDKSLKNTRALDTYKATMGEGKNLDLVTDGDHLVYRGKAGELLVMTYPEDAGRGDSLWVFDKTGNQLLGTGVAHEGKLRWQ